MYLCAKSSRTALRSKKNSQFLSSTKVMAFSFAAAKTVTLKNSPALYACAFQIQAVLPEQNRNHRFWL